MIRFALLLAMNFIHAQLNQAPCTEDSHCSIGFYCEETALFCRKCLRCEDHKRESPLQRDLCVKSVVQCGDCLKGLVAETLNGNDKINIGCVSYREETGSNHPYLPSYAWAAIAIGLFLMLLTVCVFLKTKMFKVVSYSSRTSVHSLRETEAAEREASAPPPYNYHLPSTFPPGSPTTEMLEIRRLVDSPELCLKPSLEPQALRPREAAGNQEARVFNNPAYVRIPQNQTRCNTPEVPALETETAAGPVANDANTPDVHLQSTENIVKFDNDTLTNVLRCESHNRANESTQRNRILACAEIQDSNNNYPPEPGRGPKRGSSAGARLVGGPSFVINVVENVSSLHQRNHTNCYHPDTS